MTCKKPDSKNSVTELTKWFRIDFAEKTSQINSQDVETKKLKQLKWR
jgi:hypothetical protein